MAKELKDLTKSDVFSTLNPTPTLTSATEPPHYPYSEERKEKNKRWLKLALLTLLGFIVLGGTLRLWEPWVERFDLDEISCMCDKNVNDYVDLGLSVKWATCNVGASSPSDDGDYFAWGETSSKTDYTKEDNKTYCYNLGDIAGDPNYDAARATWGGGWRLPTEDEFEELINNCTWTWGYFQGRKGYKVTGSNGNSIFLPAAGWCYGLLLNNDGECGYYWSSAPYKRDTQVASSLVFFSDTRSVHRYGRYYGHSVRPVMATSDQEVRKAELKSKEDEQQEWLATSVTGEINGHSYVDLGLSVNWATCNVGTSSSLGYGRYYAWGEIHTKSNYSENNSKTYCKSMNDIAGDSNFDVARASWGGGWRLPTEAELEELKLCSWSWATKGGKNGYKVTGPNGNSIFLPMAGYRSWELLYDEDEEGAYWSSTPYKDISECTYALSLDVNGCGLGYAYRYQGHSVRPVVEKSTEEKRLAEEKAVKEKMEQERLAKEPAEQKRKKYEQIELMAVGATGEINGHYCVDLGLSVKWATCNVGASSPSDDGDYFAWGETSPKPIFTEKNNKTSGKKLIGDIAGNPNYDAARANWGGSWRLPTEYEFSELRNNCTWIWTNQGGTSGYTVMGKNGNSIFLSAAGGYDGKANSPIVYGDGDGVSLLYVGKSGYYWCSTPCGSPGSENVFFMGFSRSDYSTNWAGIRYNGYSVRPVSE